MASSCRQHRVPPFHRLHTVNGCAFAFSSATGYLSRDTFHLGNGGSGAATESISGVVFGCAHSITGFQNGGTLGGVLSLSPSPLSLPMQLGARRGGRFSYCLPKPTQRNPHTFLRLGADVPSTPPGAHTTTLAVHPGPKAPGYYLSLVGISLGNKRLDIDQHVFAAGHGCSINPAETITTIAEPAYLAVEHALVAHMKDLGSNRVKGPLCFDRINRSVRARLPSMVFHFEDGAELWFTVEQLFEVRGSLTACFLEVGRGQHRMVIGAAQQVNTRFTFDIGAGRLAFTPELCG